MPNGSSLQHTQTQVRDVLLETVEAGDGPPLLFLHGMSGTDLNGPVIDRLAQSFHVLAPSHPGYGASPRPSTVDTIDDLAYIYLDYLQNMEQQFGPVAVVGCSIGAWIAAEVAVRSDASISSLVLSTPLGVKVGGTLDLDYLDLYAVSAATVREAMYHDSTFGLVDLGTMDDDQLTRHFRNLEATALYGWKPYMHNPKLHGRLARISVPTLVLQGDSDGFINPLLPAAYRDSIEDAVLETIAQAGHEPEREQVEAFVSVASQFLSRASILQNS